MKKQEFISGSTLIVLEKRAKKWCITTLSSTTSTISIAFDSRIDAYKEFKKKCRLYGGKNTPGRKAQKSAITYPGRVVITISKNPRKIID